MHKGIKLSFIIILLAFNLIGCNSGNKHTQKASGATGSISIKIKWPTGIGSKSLQDSSSSITKLISPLTQSITVTAYANFKTQKLNQTIINSPNDSVLFENIPGSYGTITIEATAYSQSDGIGDVLAIGEQNIQIVPNKVANANVNLELMINFFLWVRLDDIGTSSNTGCYLNRSTDGGGTTSYYKDAVIKVNDNQLTYGLNNNFYSSSYLSLTTGSTGTVYIYHPEIGEITKYFTVPQSLTSITTLPDNPNEWSTCSSIVVSWAPVACDAYETEISLYDQSKNYLRGWRDIVTDTSFTLASALTHNDVRATYVTIKVTPVGYVRIFDFHGPSREIEVYPKSGCISKSNLP